MQIDIDFDVFKALTVMRQSEVHSYNDVIRDLLGLESKDEMKGSSEGRLLGGRFLPNGTKLRAKYKDGYYEAEIRKGGLWYNEKRYSSASSAARAVTGTNVNGLTFWEVKRPNDFDWLKILMLARDK